MAEWLPISTAPKDGRDIALGFFDRDDGAIRKTAIMVGHWFDGRFAVKVGASVGDWIFLTVLQVPWTHWAPLPPPPSDIDPDEPRGGEGIS